MQQRFVFLRARARLHRDPRSQRRQLARRRQAVGKVGFVHHHRRRAVTEHVRKPRGLLADAQRHRNRAKPRNGEQAHHEFVSVAQQQRDSVASDYPASRHPRGEPARLIEQGPVADAARAADQRVAIGVAPHRFEQHRMQAGGPLRETAHDPVAVMRFHPGGGPGVVPSGHAVPRLSAATITHPVCRRSANAGGIVESGLCRT